MEGTTGPPRYSFSIELYHLEESWDTARAIFSQQRAAILHKDTSAYVEGSRSSK